jgi:S-adenosylmethionine/arginine decarboxylase-like enzyme
MEGFHIVSTLKVLNCNKKYLYGGEHTGKILKRLIKKSGLTPMRYSYATFPDNSYSACYILAESHVALHIWANLENDKKEKINAVTLDVYTCNFNNVNDEKCRNLYNGIKDLFNPEIENKQEIRR